MKNTRSKILLSAKKLFNEQGYSNVTIRMIALDLKISSGNLNYHFKKREEILEALYFEMVEEFDARIEELSNKSITLKTISEDIFMSLKRMVDYSFFWTDLYYLLKLNEKIKNHFQEAYKNRVKGYRFLFNYLIENGIMQNFELEKEREFLIERMISISNTWLYNSCLYNEKIDNDYIIHQRNNLMFNLFPYLTELGKKQNKRALK